MKKQHQINNANIIVTKNGESEYIPMIEDAFQSANEYYSKLPEWVLNINGMSGKKYRHLINNLTSKIPKPDHLEIGLFKGSTTVSACYGNDIKLTAIDNWIMGTEIGEKFKSKEKFKSNIGRMLEENKNMSFDFELVESDYMKVEHKPDAKYNMYMFDGPHEREDHYNALSHVYDYLDDEFIFICDDWNWDFVREETQKSIIDLELNLVYSTEILTEGFPGCNGGEHSDWHNGYLISILKKY